MDFSQNARFVAWGHVMKPPTLLTYASVVPYESVHISFLLRALNRWDILAGGVGNAYLNAPSNEKIFTMSGPEFGLYPIAKVAVYGLKSSGAAWRLHMTQTMWNIGFHVCLVDNNVRGAQGPLTW